MVFLFPQTIKRSIAKDAGDAPNKHPDLKTNGKPVDKEDQVFLDELERLKRQEKDANDAAEALRKEFAQQTEDLLFKQELLNLAGAVADFTNLETVVNVSPIPTSRINSFHPSTLILGDPQSAVQTRSKVTKSSRAHAFERIVAVQDSESLGFFIDLPVWEKNWNKETLSIWNVKSDFLYGKIDEAVYCSLYQRVYIDPISIRREGLQGSEALLWVLHQDPEPWSNNDIILVQVYGDDIIFGSTKKSWCDEFEALMKSRFQMSSMGELTFFLGLQVKQKEDGIFISQDKYVAEILKKFDFINVKTASTPIETQKPLVKDEEASDVDVHLYRSMIGSLMYLTASRPDIMFTVCACSRSGVHSKTSFK
ncbi:putative ribonuclease H-like domain-containing protein [Tanacetum coccineum]